MTKKYKNEEYMKTKLGTNNYTKAINLLEKIWPNKMSFTGNDLNKLYEGLMENVDVKRLKKNLFEQPIKSKIEKNNFDIKSLMITNKLLYKDLGKAKKSITVTV